MLKTINRAIQEHRVVQITYQSLGKPAATRYIEPYGVVLFQSSIYVVATDPTSDGEDTTRLRHWKLDRFKAAKALDKWFKPNESIDLHSHLGQSVGIFSGAQPTEYTIRLSPQAAMWVQEEPWHTEQQLETQQDGSCVLRVKAYHDTEIIQRVLRLGAEAEVIEPVACREAIREIVCKLCQRYRRTEDGT